MESVAEGQTLIIVGRTANNRWVLVRLANGQEGWIAAESSRIAAPLDDVPVVHGIAPPQVVGWQTSGQTSSQNSGQSGGQETQPTGESSATPEGDRKQPSIASGRGNDGGNGDGHSNSLPDGITDSSGDYYPQGNRHRCSHSYCGDSYANGYSNRRGVGHAERNNHVWRNSYARRKRQPRARPRAANRLRIRDPIR